MVPTDLTVVGKFCYQIKIYYDVIIKILVVAVEIVIFWLE